MILFRYVVCLLGWISCLYAQDVIAEKVAEQSAFTLLPVGSILNAVKIPQYNENRLLESVLQASAMMLKDQQTIEAKEVRLYLYDSFEQPKGQLDMISALFDRKTNWLKTEQVVAMNYLNFRGTAEGLIYNVLQEKGFLLGCVKTLMLPETLEAKEEKNTAVISSQPQSMREDVNQLLKENQLPIEQNASPEKVSQPEGKPNEVLQDLHAESSITCEGGMYFNAEKNVMVYMKNVKVRDVRLHLDGADELQVFLEPKEQEVKDAKKKDGTFAKLGDVRYVKANGHLKILKLNDANKPPIEASGSHMEYDLKTGDVLISGGYPWVRQGAYYARSKKPDQVLRIQKSGSFKTEGSWEMGGNTKGKL